MTQRRPPLFAVLAGLLVVVGAVVLLRASVVVGDAISLAPGCNNVSLTWPDGTLVETVAAAVSPPAVLVAIWLFDAGAGRFLGWSPDPAAPRDLTTVNLLDAVYLCVQQTATLTRPDITPPPTPRLPVSAVIPLFPLFPPIVVGPPPPPATSTPTPTATASPSPTVIPTATPSSTPSSTASPTASPGPAPSPCNTERCIDRP